MIFAAQPSLDDLLAGLLWWVVVLALILFGIWVIVLIRSRFRDHEDHAAGAHLMLSQLGELHREGNLSDDEFRSIKSRLVETIDDAVREPNGDAAAQNTDSADETPRES